MKFSGRLQIEADPRNWLKTDLNLNHGRVELVSGDDVLGSWSTAHVKAERVEGDRFELQLGEDRAVFAADDALAFSYEALPALAKKTVITAATGLRGKLRKGLTSSDRPAPNEPTSVGVSTAGALAAVFTSDHSSDIDDEVVEAPQAPRKLRDLIQAAVRSNAMEQAAAPDAWWGGEDHREADDGSDHLASNHIRSDSLDSAPVDSGLARSTNFNTLEDFGEPEAGGSSEDTTELLPEASGVPMTNRPETNWPDTNRPDTNRPETNWPHAILPDTNLPKTDKPVVDLPEDGLPESDLKTASSADDQLVNPGLGVKDQFGKDPFKNPFKDPFAKEPVAKDRSGEPAYDLSPLFAEPSVPYDRRERARPSRGLLDMDAGDLDHGDFEHGETLGERPAEPFGWIRAAEEGMGSAEPALLERPAPERPAPEQPAPAQPTLAQPRLEPVLDSSAPVTPSLGDAPTPVLRSLDALINEVRSGAFSPAQVGALTALIKAVAEAIEDKNRP